MDLDRLRRETPGCERWAHFNNAGASLMPSPVLDAVIDHLRLEAEIGGYEAADAAARAARARCTTSVAGWSAARRDEIALVENATRAWNMAFYALPLEAGRPHPDRPRRVRSNYMAFLHLARARGVRIEVVPDDEHGQLDGRRARERCSTTGVG